jgi:hypothetical protein
MADTIMYATSPVMIEIIFFAFINSDLQKQRYTKYQTSHHTHTIEKAGSSTSLLSPFPIIEI